jgi:hypothetical protein
MNNKFDELAKGLAQSTTRRQALKKFGVGLAGMALACFGLANRAEANHKSRCFKDCVRDCLKGGGALSSCEYGCGYSCYGPHGPLAAWLRSFV